MALTCIWYPTYFNPGFHFVASDLRCKKFEHPCLTGCYVFLLHTTSDLNSRVLQKKVPLFPSIWMSNHLRLSSNYHYLYITVVLLGISLNRGRHPPRHSYLKDSWDNTRRKHQVRGWTCITHGKLLAFPLLSLGMKVLVIIATIQALQHSLVTENERHAQSSVTDVAYFVGCACLRSCLSAKTMHKASGFLGLNSDSKWVPQKGHIWLKIAYVEGK